ncbi:unnamed protein product [Meloidogyne enterolobii]|uniref:Uncharacterized protein n=1 Tax=Meloidogyne enterolobii TaxID=390850 RepID=A0ACB1B7P0_MELEN
MKKKLGPHNFEKLIEENMNKIKNSEQKIEELREQISESRKQIEAISTEIEPLLEILKEKDEYFSKNENEELKKNWKMYCYIEKYNTQFEQPKVLKLHYCKSYC